MLIDRVRSAVPSEPVRRLMGSAPSTDDLRSAISDGWEALIEAAPSAHDLRSAFTDGVEAVSEGLGTVAERVDRSADVVREHVTLPEQLFRSKPVRRGPPPAVIAFIGAGIALAIGIVLGRTDRLTWTTVRDRSVRIATRMAHRAGAFGRHLANVARGAAAVGTQAITPDAPVSDDVLEARVRSALGRASGLHVIKIEAADGIVRVEGSVEPGGREPALAMLRSVPGVREIEDRLAVGALPATQDASNGRDAALAPGEVTTGTDASMPRP